MKITLLKNLEMGGKEYSAGQEVEVEEDIYKWLMNSYVKDRELERQQMAAIEAQLLEKALKNSKRGRK